jgi:subtilase family protein
MIARLTPLLFVPWLASCIPRLCCAPPQGQPADRVDERTGEAWLAESVPPRRVDDLSTPSFRSLTVARLWEELNRVAPVALVALKSPSRNRGAFRGRVLLSSAAFDTARARLLAIPGVTEVRAENDRGTVRPIQRDGQPYPAVLVRIDTIAALARVRELPFVDFVEPLYFLDGTGCALPPYGGNSGDGTFSPIPAQRPDAVPWTFSHMGIPDAWGLFNNGSGVIVAPGRGAKLGIVDTGVYPTQTQLNELFPLPPGTRNPATHLSVRADPTVNCSHGTRMAGLAAAPADGSPTPSPNIVGVAWGSDMVTVKIGDGVVHHGGLTGTAGTVKAVVAGLDAAVTNGARVITMAFGLTFVSDYVRDNIVRIFDANPGVIFVAAAGTGEPFVVFPASMNREVTAVSIVYFSPGPGYRYQMIDVRLPSEIVAYGPDVDFVALTGPGDIPTTGDGTTVDVTTISGSSSGTAHVAGIIALVWSRNPTLSRAEVLDRLAQASSYKDIENHPISSGKSADVGWGIPDAYVAAGGSRWVTILGPEVAQAQTSYTLTASPQGAGVYTYQWDSGEPTQAITAVAGSSGSRTHTVTVRNAYDGRTLQASHTVVFSGVHLRTLYSDELVSEWATFLDGKRVDRVVNAGKLMVAGCAVGSVAGLEYRPQPSPGGPLLPSGTPVVTLDNGNNGFTVSRAGGVSPLSLETIAHVWHDGVSAIRMRVTYVVWEPDGVDCNLPGATITSP